MALSLEQYAEFLEKRGDPAPAGPEPEPFPRAKPFVKPLAGIRAVIWSGYGTLMLTPGSEVHLLNPDAIMRRISLEKTIQEFKMWQSMSRKPGEPSQYMATIIEQIVSQKLAATTGLGVGNKPEYRIEKVWDAVLDRLVQKDYAYDVAFYGDREDFTRKIAYYYVRASQGSSLFPRTLTTLRELKQRGLGVGIHADGQCVTPVTLGRLLAEQGRFTALGELFDPALCIWSYETGLKKESPGSWQTLGRALADRGIEPASVLYVGNDPERDLAPARKREFRTALFLGDRHSADVRPEQLKDPRTRPDILLTSLDQILDVVTG